MNRPSDINLLEHILESCAIISRRVGGIDRAAFAVNDVLLDSIVRQIENIGEAARLISPEFKNKHPAVPWPLIQAMRNRLIHAYWATDAGAVWETAANEIPVLTAQIKAIIAKEQS